ncbi:histone lysine demethylase JMJC1/KDM5D/JARID1D [Toxoplasma gondii TgCatPRC2]|uniref:Histone lysine demethylase JMJC1/KDM5D/JARID1D n=1 Tax=Toxoplasma gondii TgCatPRC2 TaxID=1130821 RepID=A0A151GZX5_TOXGO|nr:histone lysine demethylase JMJC1/KDM5D/JARID1D [Toxoplasma gondii TgCatPRC2]
METPSTADSLSRMDCSVPGISFSASSRSNSPRTRGSVSSLVSVCDSSSGFSSTGSQAPAPSPDAAAPAAACPTCFSEKLNLSDPCASSSRESVSTKCRTGLTLTGATGSLASAETTSSPRVEKTAVHAVDAFRSAEGLTSPALVSASSPPSPVVGSGSSSRPQRNRRAPRKFEVEDASSDASLRKALEKSRLERRRVQLDSASLPPVPEIKLESMEDFLVNPIALFEKLEHYGREFGAVKIIPPDNWQPPFSLNGLLTDELEFHVRVQDVHTLMQGQNFRHPPQPMRASELQKLDRDMKTQLFGREDVQVAALERVYWQSVESSSPEVTVHYAADLKTNEVGSGFPTDASSAPSRDSEVEVPRTYATHPWNLTRLAREDGSLLAAYHRDVAGVTSPWLYVGMVFSTFCWHTEDNFFAACNYHHWGAPKVWYLVPPSRAPSVERLLQSYLSEKDPEYVLHSLTVQLPPALFVENRIPIYRTEQRTNEFLLLWPRTFHAGFNAGFNCNEACNFAPASWLSWGRKSVHAYRFVRSTCIPFHQLLLRATAEATRTRLSAAQLLHLLRALMELVHEEFAARKAAREAGLVALAMVVDCCALDAQVDPLRRLEEAGAELALDGLAAELLKCEGDLRSMAVCGNPLLRPPPQFYRGGGAGQEFVFGESETQTDGCVKSDALCSTTRERKRARGLGNPRGGETSDDSGGCTPETEREREAATAAQDPVERREGGENSEQASGGRARVSWELTEEGASFLKAASTVAALPVKDCDSCRACCAVSCVVSPQSLEHACLDCLDADETPLPQRVVLMRFALPALRGLVDFLLSTFLRKCDEESSRGEGETKEDSARAEASENWSTSAATPVETESMATPTRGRTQETLGQQVKTEGSKEGVETGGASGAQSTGKKSRKRRAALLGLTGSARRRQGRRGSIQEGRKPSAKLHDGDTKKLVEQLRQDPLYVHLPTMEELVQFEEVARPRSAGSNFLFFASQKSESVDARARKKARNAGAKQAAESASQSGREKDCHQGRRQSRKTARLTSGSQDSEKAETGENGEKEEAAADRGADADGDEETEDAEKTKNSEEIESNREATPGNLMVSGGSTDVSTDTPTWTLVAAVDDVAHLFQLESETRERRTRRRKLRSTSPVEGPAYQVATPQMAAVGGEVKTETKETKERTTRAKKRQPASDDERGLCRKEARGLSKQAARKAEDAEAEEMREEDPWMRFATQLTWRYFLTALKDEEDDNDEKILPMFKKAEMRRRTSACDPDYARPPAVGVHEDMQSEVADSAGVSGDDLCLEDP